MRRVFVAADGRVRTPWRFLFFLVVAAALMQMIGAALFAIDWTGLLPQGVAMLTAALVAGWTALVLFDGRPPGALGFAWTRRTPFELAAGMGLGVGALLVAAAAMALVGGLAYTGDAGGIGDWVQAQLFWLLLLAVPAAAEEALFRGYGFQALVQGLGAWPATLVLSGAFAVAHTQNPNVTVFALVNIFLAGVLLSVAYLRTRSLWFATAVHLGWNWAMAVPLDLPVSGLTFIDTPLYEPVVRGPEWWTGGLFGPEGGVVAALGFLAALVALLRIPAFREAEEMRELRPLVDETQRSPLASGEIEDGNR